MPSKKKPPPPLPNNNDGNRKGGEQNGASTDEYMEQLDSVVDLLQKKAYGGQVSTAEVEAAVSGVLTNLAGGVGGGSGGRQQLQQQLAKGSKKKSKKIKASQSPTQAASSQQSQIKVDNSNYDDDDDDDENYEAATGQKPVDSKKEEEYPATKPDDVESGQTKYDDEFNDDKEDEYADLLSQIPLGKEGAKMMTTFGDGPKPDLAAVETALLGARKSLQFAIMDARAIRRRARSNYDKARQYSGVKQKNPKKHVDGADSVDPNMMFRVLQSGDRLGKNPKCGFDTEQLKWLFPEEMQSYQRWNDMHSEYNKTDEKAEVGEGDDTISETGGGDDRAGIKSDQDSIAAPAPNPPDEPGIGGHLQARAANFDARTEKMKSDWYLKKFAKVRQGSFLPRGRTGRKSAQEADWEKTRKRKRGRSVGASWDSMSVLNVRFLHWLGFDPPALCPPNDETTQALAFLGYDMLGKIVEKAIFIKNLDRMREEDNQTLEAKRDEGMEIDESKVLWELREGEQLSKEDIDKAMDDPDVRPSSFHTTAIDTDESSSSHLPQFQLYFGPGFENRLELEMEE